MASTACGDGEDGGNKPAATRPADEDEEGDEDAADEEDADDGEEEGDYEGDEDGGNGGGDIDEMLALLKRLEDATFAVTLTMSAPAGLTEEAFSGEMVWLQDGPNVRFEISGEQQGQSFRAIVIGTEEGGYFCMQMPPLPGTCMGGEAGEDTPLSDFTDIFSEIETEVADTDAEVRRIDDRKIAGQKAICFEVSGADDGEGTMCLSADGVPLLLDIETAEGSIKMEATEFAGSVPPDAFEPPFEVTESPFGEFDDLPIDE
jgi:hypothetical protein